MAKLYKNADWLRLKYVDEELSAPEIAEMADCHFSTIYYWLKKHDIGVRDQSEAKEIHYKDPRVRAQRAQSQTELWRDPEYRRNQMKTRNSEEFRQRQSEIASQAWEDEGYRRHQCEVSSALWRDPEYRTKTLPALLARWDDPEYVEAHLKRLEEFWSKPENRRMMSEQASKHLKTLWRDPEWRHQKSEHVKSYMGEITSQRWVAGEFDGLFTSPTQPEQALMSALDDAGVDYDFQYRPEGYARVYDFYIPRGNLLIEYDGWFWHDSDWAKEHGLKERDREKDTFAKENGFELLRIKQKQLDQMGARAIVVNEIAALLG